MQMIDFVRESNAIERIHREPTEAEIRAHYVFCELEKPTVQDLCNLVKVLQPNARLRDNMSVPNVRLGNHIAPPSGPEIREQLEYLLNSAYENSQRRMTSEHSPFLVWRTHCDYEALHPFTDGNGRSGRALWLWCMDGSTTLGFLHSFYYQTLSAYS